MKWSDEESYGTAVSNLDTENYQGLYFISDETNAYSMWIASTNAENSRPENHGAKGDFVCYAYHDNGQIYYDNYKYSGGFRPLVCLKSKVRLEKQDDGSYEIK